MDLAAEVRECACGHIRNDHGHFDVYDCLALGCECEHFTESASMSKWTKQTGPSQ